MLEYKKSRLEMEPINCNYITPSGENIETLEFRRVVCKGVYDETRSIYVGPRSRSISGVTENGYYLITPLMPVSSSTESSWWRFWSKKPNISEDDVPEITLDEVVGVIRGSEKPSIFV
nr:surfeit locus protein 1 [Tanacetum cinerariifolium]